MNHEKQEPEKENSGQDLARLVGRQARKAHLAVPWAAHAGLAPGMQVLDIGAGSGALTLVYARMVLPGGMVLAVDSNEAALAHLSKAAASETLPIITLCQLAWMPIPASEPPDRVVVTDTLHHAADPRGVLRSARAVMQATSLMLIAEYDPESAGLMGAPLAQRIPSTTLREWLAETGFIPGPALRAPDEHYVIIARPERLS